MKIEIEMLREHEDGSADFRLDTDEKGAKFLLAYGFEHALREGIKNMEIKVYDTEDEAWEEQQRLNDIQARNRASMAAWNAAGAFTARNADRLGRLTLREAFEQGFREGYELAKRNT